MNCDKKNKEILNFKFIILSAILPAIFLGVLIFMALRFFSLGMSSVSIIFSLLFFAMFLMQILYTKFMIRKYRLCESEALEKTKVILKDQEKIGKMLIRRDLELTKANEELKNLDKMKSEFLGIVAHQLRTPLSGIKWTLDMVLKNDIKNKDEQRVFLMKANESNGRMIKLVNDMLLTDRVESSSEKYERVPTQIKDLLDSVLFDVLPQINIKNLSVRINNIDKDLPKINVDNTKIRAVFQNLLENSIKYTKPNGNIILDFNLSRKFIQFSIKDDGIGIPESQQKNIFGKFFRGDNARRIVADGSGLGLFIIKAIIENHGGEIWFESEQDKGSTFYFTLPLSK